MSQTITEKIMAAHAGLKTVHPGQLIEAEIDLALARLIGHGRTAMGTLFKAASYAHPSLGAPPGFE